MDTPLGTATTLGPEPELLHPAAHEEFVCFTTAAQVQDSGTGNANSQKSKAPSLFGRFLQPMKDVVTYTKSAMALDKAAATDRASRSLESKLQQTTESKANLGDSSQLQSDDEQLLLTDDTDGEDEISGVDTQSTHQSFDQEAIDPKSSKPNTGAIQNLDVRNLFGQPLIGAAYAPIVLQDGTTTAHTFVAAALKVKLAVSQTQIVSTTDTSTYGGKAQQLLKKAPEAIIHTSAEILSAIVTTPLILAANGLADLAGSFQEVKDTYATAIQNFGGESSGVQGKVGAGMMAGAAFIKWAFANAASLTAAGLSMILNVAIGLVDKMASGAIALAVNVVAHTCKFVNDNKKEIALAAVMAGVGIAIGFLIHFAIGSAVVAAGVATTGYVLAGIVGLAIVVRIVRLAYQSYTTTSQVVEKALYKYQESELSEKIAAQSFRATGAEEGDYEEGDLEKAHGVKDRALNTFYGSTDSRQYLASKADATHSRVISREAGHYAKAAGRDFMRTFSSWNKGADDVTITRRALAFKSDVELENEVVAYKVDKKVTEPADQALVKQALMASLIAGRKVAKQEYVTTVASASEIAKLGGVVSGDDLKAARATAYLFSGSDSEILEAVKTYTTVATEDEDGEIAYPEMYSTTLQVAMQRVDIDAVENRVAINAQVVEMRKSAPAMAAVINDPKSGFVNYLKTVKDVEVTHADDRATFNGIEIAKPTSKAKFDEAAFNAVFEFKADGKIDGAEDEISNILESDEAVKLMNAYTEYTALSRSEKSALQKVGHAKPEDDEFVAVDLAGRPTGADGLPVVDAEEDAMLDEAADLNPLVDAALDEFAAPATPAYDRLVENMVAEGADGVKNPATLVTVQSIFTERREIFNKADQTNMYFKHDTLFLLISKSDEACHAYLDAVLTAFEEDKVAEKVEGLAPSTARETALRAGLQALENADEA